MKAETLKKSILQYAMQGKLVAQDPNDEPANELLKRIKAEKEQLIKDGKIKKEKPLPPITEEEIPYELPQGWEWIRLGDICKLSQGNKVKNVQLPLLNAKYLRFKLEKIIYTEGILVNNGDYLILVDGENSGEVFYAFEDGIMGSTFKLLDISNYVSLNFVLKILQFYQAIFRGSKKGAAIPHLDKTLFKNIVIGLPPLTEQQRIVEKLEEILPLVEEYGKNEEILSEMNKKLPKQIRQSILQYAVQGKLVPQNPNDEPASELLKRIKAEKEQLIKDGKIKKEKPLIPITEDEIPYELPQGWEWVRISDIGEVSRGKSKHRPRNDKRLFGGKYPFIQTGDVARANTYVTNHAQTYSEFGLSQSRLFPKGTICITIAANIGDVAILSYDACFPDSIVGVIPFLKVVEPMYILYFLKIVKIQLEQFAPATAQKNINLGILDRLYIPLPPLAEQQRIVTKVEELMQIVDKLENEGK